MLVNAITMLVGIGLLWSGGELLIRGAVAVAKQFSVSNLVTGIVIVGFGTSAPELVVSVTASLDGLPDVAVGNVVGSNICNVLLILGSCALLSPLSVNPSSISRDAITLTVVCIVFIVFSRGELGLTFGLLFLSLFVAYLIWLFWSEQASKPPQEFDSELSSDQALTRSTILTLGSCLFGLVLLVVGSGILVNGARSFALEIGMSEAIVSLTIIAVGTSLPEYWVSIIATLKKQGDIAIANVLGSNIFNLLAILGVSSLLEPLSVSQRITCFDQWVMLGSAVLLIVVVYWQRGIARFSGGLMLAMYLSYVVLGLTVWG